jgi:hypothetical protein
MGKKCRKCDMSGFEGKKRDIVERFDVMKAAVA